MPSPPVHDRPSGLALYRRAFAEARPFWPHLAGVLLLGLSALPLALLLPIPVKIVVDTVLGGHPLDPALARFIPDRVEASADGLLVTAALLGTVFPALMALHHFADWSFRDWLAERMVLDFRTRLLRKGLDCPHANADRGSQDATHRIQHDAPALQWTALYGIIPVVTCLASLAGVVTVTAMIDPVLAGTAVATAIPVLGIVHFGQSRLGDRWARAKDAEAGAFAIIQEVLANARLISTFGKADWEAARFGTHGADAVRQRHRIVRVEASLAMLISVTIGMGAAAVLFLGTRSVLSGTLTVGDLLVVIGYLAQLFAPVQQIGTHITGQQRALVSAARAFALMDAEAALPERPDARALGRARGAFVLRDVTMAFQGRTILEDVSLKVPAGCRVGIVGRTGSGKSTLLNLLMRQLDPVAGSVLLDGRDLRDIRLADLRRQFTVVPQDPALLSTTIARNIAYGQPDADMARIMEAARMAAAHDFIMRLPHGYDTPVGERGNRLSGGERQRIAIARAFLLDAPVLILDEPTSAIDAGTEGEILESLDRLMRGRTTFLIAHRLATLRSMDMVLRLDGGRVTVEKPATDLRLAS